MHFYCKVGKSGQVLLFINYFIKPKYVGVVLIFWGEINYFNNKSVIYQNEFCEPYMSATITSLHNSGSAKHKTAKAIYSNRGKNTIFLISPSGERSLPRVLG